MQEAKVLRGTSAGRSMLVGRPPRRDGVPADARARHRVLVDAAKARLAAEPGAPHPIEEVAATLGVSASHLAHVFRDDTGVSLHQYLLQMRMSLAVTRLTHSPRDLSRLALDLGFATHSHFTSAFRRTYGVPPSGVRRLLDDHGMEARR